MLTQWPRKAWWPQEIFFTAQERSPDTPRARPTGREWELNPLPLPQRSELAERRTCPYPLGHRGPKRNLNDCTQCRINLFIFSLDANDWQLKNDRNVGFNELTCLRGSCIIQMLSLMLLSIFIEVLFA